MVFHGIQPDWIEEEMADDIDFKKDVLEQRIRTIIRDQVVLNYLQGIQNGLGDISNYLDFGYFHLTEKIMLASTTLK